MRTEPTADDLLSLFPPETRIDGDGTLVVGGCRLDDVAAEFGTPAIVVAEDALRNRARGLPRGVPQPVAAKRSGVRVEIVSVYGGSAGDGRRGPSSRRGGRR